MSLTQGPTPHPTKRKRSNEETDTLPNGLPPITRSFQFWFKDGSVVIQAESTQFRVHHSVLSLHSTVLKDCFQLPQPDGEPTVEGCPVLHLSDSAADIEHLLCLFYALYDTADLRKPIPFAITSVTIRLGRKYDLVRFVDDAIGRLKHGFPKELEQWGEADYTQVFTETKGLLFDIINLASEYSINSALPGAFLRLCEKYSLEEILQGEERGDQTTARLTPQALQICLIGRDKLAPAIPQELFDFLVREDIYRSSDCITAKTCNQAFLDVLPSFFEPSDKNRHPKILFPGKDSPHLKDPGGLCEACVSNVTDLYECARGVLWFKLPRYFGMEIA